MAKKEQNDGFWPRFIITLVVVIWVALVGGNWAGHYLLSKMPAQAASDELNIPSPRPKPWRTADPELQRELDEQRQGIAGQAARKPSETVTASPVPEAPAEKAEKPKDQAMATPAPKPPKTEPRSEEEPPAPPATPEKPAAEKTPEPSPAADEPPAPTPEAGGGDYRLQFGSFSSEENARELAQKLEAEGQDARVEPVDTGSGTVYRVSGGSYADEAAAKAQAERLKASGVDVYVRQ